MNTEEAHVERLWQTIDEAAPATVGP